MCLSTQREEGMQEMTVNHTCRSATLSCVRWMATRVFCVGYLKDARAAGVSTVSCSRSLPSRKSHLSGRIADEAACYPFQARTHGLTELTMTDRPGHHSFLLRQSLVHLPSPVPGAGEGAFLARSASLADYCLPLSSEYTPTPAWAYT